MLQQYQKLLREFIAFPTVSTDQVYQPALQQAVNWLKSLLTGHGWHTQLLGEKNCNPIVFAEYQVDPKLPTVLIYGHYDVQPAEQADGWIGDPFELQEVEGKLVARGVVDNKGQLLIHFTAIQQLIEEKKLRYNVKWLLEGNEESGNPAMENVLKQHQTLLKADKIIISDGEIVGNHPLVTLSLRGMVNLTFQLKTADTPAHSGLFGGTIPNAALEMNRILAKLMNSRKKVAIPGFYDEVDLIGKLVKEQNAELGSETKKLMEQIGVKKMMTERNYDYYTQQGLRPTLQITGLQSGYAGEGYANIVPNTATVKLNARLVCSQEPKVMAERIKKWLLRQVPSYAEGQVIIDEMAPPVKLQHPSEELNLMRQRLESIYGHRALLGNSGGGIPIVEQFQRILKVNPWLVDLANDDCNMHGVNENFDLDLIQKGLQFSCSFFANEVIEVVTEEETKKPATDEAGVRKLEWVEV